MLRLRQILFLLLVFQPVAAWSQLATVRGFVRDAESGQSLAGVNVLLQGEGNTFGAATDQAGLFTFTSLTPGKYHLVASFLSYTSFTDTLEVSFGDALRLTINLQPTAEVMGQVVVESEQSGVPSQNEAGVRSVRPTDLARTASISVSKDLVDYLLTIPGIVSAGDRGGQLFIRGGTPTENLVLVDGVPLYQPFHIVGTLSAFPEQIVSYADVYTGGFGARYGGRISSVIDVSTRTGNKRRWAGSASADPFLATAHIEGPVSRDQLSIIGSVRESTPLSYIPEFLRPNLPYRYGDRFVKLHAYLTQTSSLSGVGIKTYDRGNLAEVDGESDTIGWKNEAYGLRLLHLPAEFPAIAEVQLSKTHFSSTFGPDGNPTRYSATTGYRSDFNFIYLLNRIEARFGMFFHTMKFEYKLDRESEPGNYVAEGGFFLEIDAKLKPELRIQSGFRIHTFPSQGRSTFEPRLRASWKIDTRSTVNFAAGIYHQEIVGLNDEQDIGSVFTAWGPSETKFGVPQATHLIGGWSFKPVPWLSSSIEGYYKDLSNLTVFTGKYGFEKGTGDVRGVDVQLKAMGRSTFAQLSGSLSRVGYSTGSASFSPAHDRRQQINFTGGYERSGWSFNFRFQYGSGFPFTQLTGFANIIPIDSDSDIHHTAAGTADAYYGSPFAGRLPAYNRLDISVEKTVSRHRFNSTFFAGLQNVYNRENLFYFDLFTGQRINQLSRMPSAGLRLEFL